jgi:hypothetical protein
VDQLDPGKDRVGGLLRFEPEHRLDAAFDPSIILFNTVVPFGLSVVSQERIAARFVWLPDAPEITRRNAMHEDFSPVTFS